ncbi:hypothetical protein FC96_GL002307 [Secundilactobacillus kimchicus JCM 15530]|uniref:Uncharacterized protein n=1 Tax=Secundilactobacillus kimchicus JCM 15530 TaxID=1302272 RepID=A0A0R1HLZ7_9LACO|nr:hypothetical protein FC96_GL002307 [Secundilactobacillus kimchicus JCM 15530]
MNPINYRNLTLQASIGSLTQELKKMREEVDQVHQDMNRHLSNHDVALARHEVEISDLKAGK